MKIKICGLTTPGDIQIVNELQPDFIGMVLFFEKSKRNLEVTRAKVLLKLLSPQIKPVAVMVSPTVDQAVAAQEAGFAYLQIHGKIAEEVYAQTSIPILKAFNVEDLADWQIYHEHDRIAGYVFDAAAPGSGKTFDWNRLTEIPRDEKLFLLAGGLTPDNVQAAITAVHPDGVDVSSGVEYADRQGKDPAKVKAFITSVRTRSQGR